MNKFALAVLLLLHAAIWAVLMTLFADIPADGAGQARVEYLMIGGWFVGHMLIVSFSGTLGNPRSEWRCLRNRLASFRRTR